MSLVTSHRVRLRALPTWLRWCSLTIDYVKRSVTKAWHARVGSPVVQWRSERPTPIAKCLARPCGLRVRVTVVVFGWLWLVVRRQCVAGGS